MKGLEEMYEYSKRVKVQVTPLWCNNNVKRYVVARVLPFIPWFCQPVPLSGSGVFVLLSWGSGSPHGAVLRDDTC